MRELVLTSFGALASIAMALIAPFSLPAAAAVWLGSCALVILATRWA